MAINTASSALHLNLPSGPSQSRSPALVTVHPSVLAQILDHHSRKDSTQPRVIGTLLGTRTIDPSGSGEIEIRDCFALPHVESEEQVAVDFEYHKSMMELMGKVAGGREVIVGWYSSSPKITPYSALIQNFFSQETSSSSPAIHLTFDCNLQQQGDESSSGSGLSIKAYVSQQVGSSFKPENQVFLPVACAVKYQMTEKAGLDLLLPSNQTQTQNSTSPAPPPLQSLSSSLSLLSSNLTQIQSYVQSVISGETPADPQVGRYLLEAVGRWKASQAGVGAGSEGGDEGEEGVKKGLQDVLSVSYLAALVRTQVELSGRLNLLT